MDVDTQVDHTRDQKLAPHHAAGHTSTHAHHHTATHDLSLARGPQLQAQPPVQEGPAPSPGQAPMMPFKADTSAADGKSGGSVPSSGLSAAPSPELHIPLPKQQKKKPEPAQEKATGDKSKEKGFVSRGMFIHNEITYRFIDWILNSSIGVGFGLWSARTESGQKIFTKPVSNIGKKVIDPIFKSQAAREEGVKWFSMIMGIIIGGFMIIPLMMAMENKNNKKKIVRQLDTWMYGEDAVKNDPKFEESYKKIDEEPKKGFWGGMVARAVALAPLIAAVTWPKSNMLLKKYLFGPISMVSRGATDLIGMKPGGLLLKEEGFMARGALERLDGNPLSTPQFQSNWDKMHETIGFDLGLTFIYSFIHEAAFKSTNKVWQVIKGWIGWGEGKNAEAPAQSGDVSTGAAKREGAEQAAASLATTKEEPAPSKWSHKLSVDEKEKTAERADASWTQRRQNDAALIAAPGIA